VTDPEIELRIVPEPTDEEAAAVAAAIALLSSVTQPVDADEPGRRPSRWSLSGRRAAHASSPASSGLRWSRLGDSRGR